MADPLQPSLFFCPECQVSRPFKFADKLNQYRGLKRLTIAALAAKVQVNPDTLERLLSGQNAPSAANLKRIENALDISFDPEDFE
jgi:transcriptional regulator with XRE-family HTH domain